MADAFSCSASDYLLLDVIINIKKNILSALYVSFHKNQHNMSQYIFFRRIPSCLFQSYQNLLCFLFVRGYLFVIIETCSRDKTRLWLGAVAMFTQQWGALSDTNYGWYLSILPQNYNREMGPIHSSNDDVLETGLSNNSQACVSVVVGGWGGRDICMLAGAEGPVVPPRPSHWQPPPPSHPHCALHIKSYMDAIKCAVNGQELAEWLYNWISSYDSPHYKMK